MLRDTIKILFSPQDVQLLREDYPVYKVLLNFWDDETDSLIKDYTVWVTEAFIKERQKSEHESGYVKAMWTALEEVQRRMEESDYKAPREEGLACSLKGVDVIFDITKYRHIAETLSPRKILYYKTKPIIGTGPVSRFQEQMVRVPVYGTGFDIG
jgi:hypothetical protein